MSTKVRFGARAMFTLAASLAWLAVLLDVLCSAMGWFPPSTPAAHVYGHNPAGAAGALGRVVDTLSYFTIWSNIAVALAWTVTALRPAADSLWRRVLGVDALLMITVTAIIYALLLAPSENLTGISRFTNPLEHIVVPAVTVAVWLVWGPRARIGARAVLLSFAIPLLWVAYMLVRGAVINAYPYDFVDVAARGYGAVTLTIVSILLFGIVLAALFWGVDIVLSRRSRRWTSRDDVTI